MGFSDNYVYFDKDRDSFRFNKLAYLANIYDYRMKKEVYESGVTIRKEIDSYFDSVKHNYKKLNSDIEELIKRESFPERMKRFCEAKQNFFSVDDILEDEILKTYYEVLGAEKIRALSYQKSKMDDEIKRRHNLTSNESRINSEIRKVLKGGDKTTKPELKKFLQSLYDKLGIDKKAKATDIKNYGFDFKRCRIDNGFGIELVEGF